MFDFDDDDLRDFDRMRITRERETREGPCEDDYESRCPYVNIMPEESGHEHGSPLRFKSEFDAIDREIQQALREGF